MKKILLLASFLFIQLFCFSNHIAGSDIPVTRVSGNIFNITLRWFKDCNQSNNFTSSLKLGIFDKVTNAKIDSVTVSLFAVNPMKLGDSCYAPNLCVHEGVYRAQKTIPNNPSGYYISY